MAKDQASQHGGQLLRAIGFVGIALLALNGVIGSGIFTLPGAVAPQAGALSPWLFLIIGLVVITIVLTFAELSSYYRDSGGPVLFTTHAFGPLAGFSTGWILFLSRMTAFAANSAAMADYVGATVPWFSGGIGRSLLIVTVCGGLTFANYLGVRDGVRTMAFFTFMKLVPIVLLILLGMQYVGVDTLFPAQLPQLDDVGGTTLLLIYAYVGFESTTIVSGEAIDPKRSLPKALVGTIIGIAILYFLIVLVFVSVLPDAPADATLVDVGRVLAGGAGVVVITVAAIFSIGGNLASIMLAVPRLTFALAEQRMLPAWFGRVHARHSTPANSVVFLGALGTVFALTGSFAWLAAASSLTRLITYILCIGALPVIRRRATPEERAEAWHLKGGYTIPAIALLLCLWIAAQSAADAWLMTGGLLVIGLVLYAIARPRASAPG